MLRAEDAGVRVRRLTPVPVSSRERLPYSHEDEARGRVGASHEGMYPETGTGDFRGSQQLVASNFGHNSQVMLDRGCWGASADAIACSGQ